MGLFTTVWVIRPCRRCGAMRRTGVQFKIGDDFLRNYEEGAAIAATEGLKPGDVFEGTAERYCGVCSRAFHADLAVASAEALAALIELGRLELRRKGTVEAVAPDAIRAAAREFALGVEGLERFVRREPFRRVHECVFGVLALESEPVDPRL